MDEKSLICLVLVMIGLWTGLIGIVSWSSGCS